MFAFIEEFIFGTEAADYILKQSVVRRLDCAACAALGEGLRDNHSLYGLHVVGHWNEILER